jgi:hypothetical protein
LAGKTNSSAAGLRPKEAGAEILEVAASCSGTVITAPGLVGATAPASVMRSRVA